MTNATQTKKTGKPYFVIMAVRDVQDNEESEAVVSIEGVSKKLLEAYGFNDPVEIEPLSTKLHAKNPSCEIVFISPVVNDAVKAAMSISKDWHVTFNDVFKSDIVDSIIAAPAVFQPNTYIEAMEYLQHKSINTPNELNIIEQMALVSMTICGLGAYINNQPSEVQPTIRKSAYYHVKQLCNTQTGTSYEREIDSLVEAILNLFEPCGEPGPVIPPEFSEAMAKYKQMLADNNGEETDEAIIQLQKAMQLALQWFLDDVWKGATEQGLLPKPDGITDAGQPVFTAGAFAKHFGRTEAEVANDIDQLREQRKAAGLPDIEMVDPETVHRIQ